MGVFAISPIFKKCPEVAGYCPEVAGYCPEVATPPYPGIDCYNAVSGRLTAFKALFAFVDN
jgi:hypothetical protein